MSLDELIKKTLNDKSRWSGSADLLWNRIRSRLKKRPWWQTRQFAVGVAMAALLLLVFFLQVVPGPLPPELPKSDPEPQLRNFSILSAPKLLTAAPLEGLELPLKVIPSSEMTAPPTLLITRRMAGQEPVLVKEIVLDLKLLGQDPGESAQFNLPIVAPAEEGTYHLLVEGTFSQEEKIYAVYGEIQIQVQKNRKGR